MAKYDDLIITLGALVLGLGLYNIINGMTRRAYAVEAQPVPRPKCPVWHPKGTPCPRFFEDALHPEGDPFEDYMDPTTGYRYPNYRRGNQTGRLEYPRDSEAVPESDDRDFPISTYARAYAVKPLPCAAACAPFKISPAKYATCCKQHAATAAVKPAVLKSKLPKPPVNRPVTSRSGQ